MAESQATQAATQAPEPSPSLASQSLDSQPSAHSPLLRLSREEAAERQKETARRNPFSPENMAKRRQALETLRQDRGVPQPKAKDSHEPKREASSGGDAADRVAQPAGQPSDGVSPQDRTVGEKTAETSQTTAAPQGDKQASAPGSTPPVSDAQMEWYKREQEVRAAELKAKEAGTALERRQAAAEKKEAEAQAALQRLDWARSNPIEFMTEAGMTQDEWKAFLQNGGQLSPEQKRTRALEKELAETRAEMQRFMREQEQSRQRQPADMEAAQFIGTMSKFELVSRMGGIEAVRNKQQIMEQQTGQRVALDVAASALEQEFNHGLSVLLKDSAVRSKFGLDVNTSDAGPVATTPRTLNQKVAPSTPPANTAPRRGPPDWAACKAEYLRRIEAERATSSR